MRNPVVALSLALALACSGRSAREQDWPERTCLAHADCDTADSACVLGACVPGALYERMDVAPILAQQWFANPDGTCAYDEECGPWMCAAGQCVTPDQAGRQMPARAEFRYWDTSCLRDEDCGAWTCLSGWCTEPAYGNPYGSGGLVGTGFGSGTGTSCLGDSECAEGADCVWPGVCRDGAAGELMTFSELADVNWFANPDGTCATDAECGPLACELGYCVAQEYTDRARPLRSDFFYYDASCSTDDQCGPWLCVGGWCNDPAYP